MNDHHVQRNLIIFFLKANKGWFTDIFISFEKKITVFVLKGS